MKEIENIIVLDQLHYANDHEWAKKEGNTVKIGLSDYAQDQLGDIVYVELPQEGDSFDKGEEFGTVESVKAVTELYMPIGGEIVSVNSALEETPELINEEPYEDGFLIEIKPHDLSELKALLDKKAYLELLKGLK